jgi:hypothetical protein
VSCGWQQAEAAQPHPKPNLTISSNDGASTTSWEQSGNTALASEV